MLQNKRIDVLDGFRTIAILCVILFHYFSRWTMPYESFNLYPYGNKYDYFGYGYLGVQFFFMISGFVIAFTLYKTDSFKTFWKKRFARLFPAMLICSLLTFIIVRFVDTENIFPEGHSIRNFIASLSFISPSVLNYCFRSLHFNYLNGSYWSLWPEVQFYFIVSIIYFIDPEKFIRRFMVSAFLLSILNTWLMATPGVGVVSGKLCFWLGYLFNIPANIGWFAAGVLFYALYVKKADKQIILLGSLSVLLQLWGCANMEIGVMLLFIALFITFLFAPQALHFLSWKPIAAIGVASYSLYLIHETIGVLLIHRYGIYWGKLSVLFSLLIIGIMVLFSLVIYRWVEKPIGRWVHKKK